MGFSTEGYIVREAGGPIQLDAIHYEDVYEFEILVDAVAVSLCQTDLKAAKGEFLLKPPIILGHEAAGYGSFTLQHWSSSLAYQGLAQSKPWAQQ